MKIKVSGVNMDVGQSLTQYVLEHLEKAVKKYFEKAVSGEAHFVKDGHLFKVTLTINEGVRGGIAVKSDAEAGDAYGAFNEACEKSAKQLRRYKRRIKNYRRNGGGLKAVEPNYNAIDAMKYVLPPLNHNVFEEMENEETEEQLDDSHKIIAEKTTLIEELSVDEAIMKMDLTNLPALVFINGKNKKLNVVYHRRDGNISWIDPQV
ncbi:MAG: ribosomal subunit interface protein [Alphaproteobacteria bacterium RIFCSPHIGHO2_01_FULL_40_8]|nr:MAG: ribosomal subunit interface protein [Alphaproteobacteria bacterium RIFCSPHIGHO2_01_FULL_40_8]